MTGHATLRARNAVAAVFAVNGFAFASLFSRMPDVRDGLGLDNGELGLLLLVGALGSVLALPTAGGLVRRTSAAAVVRGGGVLVAAGLVLVGVGVDVLATDPLVATGSSSTASESGSGTSR